jgi:carbon storage regulator
MLVLTRKLLETLYIGDDVKVTVVRLEGNQVRLGIEAPRHIPVVRAELVESADSESDEDEPASLVASRAPGVRRVVDPGRSRYATHGHGSRNR